MAAIVPAQIGRIPPALPDFLSLDLDPQTGEIALLIKPPLGVSEAVKAAFAEFCKIMIRDIAVGGVGGALSSFTWSMAKIAFGPPVLSVIERLKCSVLYGGQLGASAGAAYGVYEAKTKITKLLLSIDQLRPAVETSTGQAMSVIKTLIGEVITDETTRTQVDIECPISHQVMAFPAKTACQVLPGEAHHTFEYVNIAHYIASRLEQQRLDASKPGPTCPLCRSILRLQELSLDDNREENVLDAAHKVFKYVEGLFQKLPKSRSSQTSIEFAQAVIDVNIAQEIQHGQQFLRDTTPNLMAKLKKPEDLSSPEAYALGYYLVQQFKPMRLRVFAIYEKAMEHLNNMVRANLIERDVLAAQRAELEKWYFDFQDRLVPDECPIVKKLYNLT